MASKQWAASGVGIVGGRAFDPAVSGRGGGSTVPRVDPRGYCELLDVEVRRAELASVDGSHLFIRRAAWLELGGFDEDFFAYYEETDLCARALAAGWRVIYEPAMVVWHSRGLSSDRVRLRRSFWARRNRLTWIAKHFPEPTWREVASGAVREYLATAVTGRANGWGRGRHLPAAERFAALCGGSMVRGSPAMA